MFSSGDFFAVIACLSGLESGIVLQLFLGFFWGEESRSTALECSEGNCGTRS